MPIFSVVMKHTPESCPMFNENVRKKFGEAAVKREEVAKKQEIRIMSAYTSTLDHVVFHILEAPSQTAVEDYLTEVGFAFWNSAEIRQVRAVEDVVRKVVGR